MLMSGKAIYRIISIALILLSSIPYNFSHAGSRASMYNCVTPAGGTTLRFDAGAHSDPRCSLFSGSSLDEEANTNAPIPNVL